MLLSLASCLRGALTGLSHLFIITKVLQSSLKLPILRTPSVLRAQLAANKKKNNSFVFLKKKERK